MSAFTDAMENKLWDFLMRGQTLVLGSSTATWSAAPTFHYALLTTLGDDAGSHVECTGGSYARAALQASLTNFNNTQGDTSGASTGTDGTGENAVEIAFPTPTAGWGSVVGYAVFDAASGGTCLWKAALTNSPQVINVGNTVKFNAAAASLQVDN